MTQLTTQAPPRPSIDSDAGIHEKALAALWEDVREWLGSRADAEDQANIIAAVNEQFEGGYDGYSIARHLHEEHDWEPDAKLVTILDHFYYHLNAAHKAAVCEWVAANNILLTRSVGDCVTVSPHGEDVTGSIFEVHHETAEYTVEGDRSLVENPQNAPLWRLAAEDVRDAR